MRSTLKRLSVQLCTTPARDQGRPSYKHPCLEGDPELRDFRRRRSQAARHLLQDAKQARPGREEPGRARQSQAKPGRDRQSQAEPGGARRSQTESDRARQSQPRIGSAPQVWQGNFSKSCDVWSGLLEGTAILSS